MVQLPLRSRTQKRYSGVPPQVALPVIPTCVPTGDGDGGAAAIVADVHAATAGGMGDVVVITWKRLGMKRIGVNQTWVEGVMHCGSVGDTAVQALITPTA